MRTTATEANELEAALLAAGRDPDLALDIWDIWQRSGIRAALHELEQQAMTTAQRPLHLILVDIDKELAELSDADVQRLADSFDASKTGGKRMEAWPEALQRQCRAGNELAKRAHQARLRAAEAEKDAALSAQLQQRNQAQIDSYRNQVRGRWLGDDASFDRAWPDMLQRYLIEQATGGVNDDRALRATARNW